MLAVAVGSRVYSPCRFGAAQMGTVVRLWSTRGTKREKVQYAHIEWDQAPATDERIANFTQSGPLAANSIVLLSPQATKR